MVNDEHSADLSGVRTGALREGEWVTLTDPKGKRHSVKLVAGKSFHTTKGGVAHDDMIGGPDGSVVTSVGGMSFLVLRPLLSDYTVTMPRGAAIIYPKEAMQIVGLADVFPGARVLEAGVGSGALSLSLLRAVGPTGRLVSVERREDFAEIAGKNVESWVGAPHPAHEIVVGDLVDVLTRTGDDDVVGEVDRVVLDMLAPWECVDAVAERLVPGGVLLCYVATTTQLGRTMDQIRVHEGFTEPEGLETTIRGWHAEGLAIRPAHGSTSHTGFLIIARRLAPGVTTPMRKRRPAPGAYGADYTGPRPAWAIDPNAGRLPVE
ncbi:tRNA (adenine-N1)-methyltransferase [Mariniluteicoccus endophyticus]